MLSLHFLTNCSDAKTELETVEDKVVECMMAAGELAVPLVVDVGYGDNWQQAH